VSARSDLKAFVQGTLSEARAPIVGIAPEIQELLSVKGRRGVIHFASSLNYQLNMVVGYSLHAGVTAEDLKRLCIQNQTKRYIVVSVPDLSRPINVIDVDNITSLTNFATLVRNFDKLKSTKISPKALVDAWDSFRMIKNVVKSPTSLIQFKYVHALRRLGIDGVKGKDPFGTKIMFDNPTLLNAISDLPNPYFKSSAGRPRNIDSRERYEPSEEFTQDDHE
jgi:hypothetical protein